MCASTKAPHPYAPSFQDNPFRWSLGFPGGSDSKESACNAGGLGQEDPLEKEIATHSSILA